MNWLSDKEVDMVVGLYEWSNRIDNLHADTEDKGLAKSVICNLLWMVTQEQEGIMTVKEIRSLTGLSQAKFAERYNIPRRTIENWESGTTKCPDYVVELLEFRVKYDVDICNK